MKTQQKGQRGEQLALNHLTAKGDELKERNYRAGRGEIDLIFQADGLLIFVEVKYRSADSLGLKRLKR
ncbi:MAG: YraN family protein, partial [Bacteroidota bacterium]